MRRPFCAVVIAAAALGIAHGAPGLRVVRNAIWGVELTLAGYEPSNHPLRDRPNFVLSAASVSGSCRMTLSMFAATARDGAEPEDCRQGGVGDPEELEGRTDARLIEEKTGPLAYSMFDQSLEARSGAQTLFHQLYGYWVRDDVCFELRVSSGDGCRAFPSKAMAILRSVRIGRDTGATLETVEFAKRRGGDPRDWRLHVLAAEAYLHDEAHRNPARARRFYTSALRLGGSRIPAADRLAIEQGLGLAWLAEDEGHEAIPHLARALQAARRARGVAPAERVQETLYALATAHAMEGKVEEACGFARTWLQEQSASEQKQAAKRIRKDPQMTALNGSDCYQSVLADLGLR